MLLAYLPEAALKLKIQARPIDLLSNMGSISTGQRLSKKSPVSSYQVQFGNCFVFISIFHLREL